MDCAHGTRGIVMPVLAFGGARAFPFLERVTGCVTDAASPVTVSCLARSFPFWGGFPVCVTGATCEGEARRPKVPEGTEGTCEVGDTGSIAPLRSSEAPRISD